MVLRIACVMMQKNEVSLLEPWVRYHAHLFGIENLFVLDNGSTEPSVVQTLRQLESEGLNVDYSYRSQTDYRQREEIVTRIFASLSARAVHDFIFPLDCDEFIGARMQNDTLAFDLPSISERLAPYLNDKRVLTIASTFDNIPDRPLFQQAAHQPKCFFANGSCRVLGIGYHTAKAKTTSESVKTPIIYLHFHNKPYSEYLFAAFNKLFDRIPDFSRRSLSEHVDERRSGFHAAAIFLQGEKHFIDRFANIPTVAIDAFYVALRAAGTDITFNNAPDVRRAFASVRGVADRVIRDGDRVLIQGWSSFRTGQEMPQFTLRIGSIVIENAPATRITRPDVNSAHPEIDVQCGYELSVPANQVSDQIGQVIAVAVGPTVDNIFVPLLSSLTLPQKKPSVEILKLTSLARSRQIYVDLGANEGNTVASFYEENPTWEIYAFEPNPLLAADLRKKFRGIRNIAIVEAAASDQAGTAKFYPGIDSSQSSTLLTGKIETLNWRVDYQHPYTVNTVDLSHWLQKNTSMEDEIILKMDIEGAEYTVLQHLLNTRILTRIAELKVEWHVDRYPSIGQGRHDRIRSAVAARVKSVSWR